MQPPASSAPKLKLRLKCIAELGYRGCELKKNSIFPIAPYAERHFFF